MTNIGEPRHNPHHAENDSILGLSDALEQARSRNSLGPVFQWMTDNGKQPLEAVLRQVSEVTRIPAAVNVKSTQAHIKGELMRILYEYTKAVPPEKGADNGVRVIEVYGDGTSLLQFVSGRRVVVFSAESYAHRHGLALERVYEVIRLARVRPLSAGLYAYRPLFASLEALRVG